MVEIFRGLRRVLRDDGTVWLNLGDSYVSDPGKGGSGTPNGRNNRGEEYGRERIAQVRDNKAVHGDVLRPHAVDGLAPKNLVGIPWRVALALQDDGWYLRCDVIWSKVNPMPESVTDRPTKSHEYIFMLTKSPRYFFDQEAVREPAEWNRWGKQTNDKHEGSESAASWIKTKSKEELQQRRTPTWEERKAAGATRGNLAFGDNVGAGTQRAVHGQGLSHDLGDPSKGRNIRSVWEEDFELQEYEEPDAFEKAMKGRSSYPPGGTTGNRGGEHLKYAGGGMPSSNPAGRNVRSVWTIPTQPYADAHFATFPERLPRRCIQASTSDAGCCPDCGAPWIRVVEKPEIPKEIHDKKTTTMVGDDANDMRYHNVGGQRYQDWLDANPPKTVGWQPGCMCGKDPVPCVVMDPFMGAGTTAHVARKLGRHAVGIELNQGYADLIASRTQQLSLLT